MLDALQRLLGPSSDSGSRDRAAEQAEAALQVAAAALLLESAAADDQIDASELRPIERGLARQFGLDAAGVRDLMVRVERARREAIDLHGFTSVIVQRYDEPRRLALAELIWSVMLADGRLTDDERILARRLGHLIELRPEQVSAARHRAEAAQEDADRE